MAVVLTGGKVIGLSFESPFPSRIKRSHGFFPLTQIFNQLPLLSPQLSAIVKLYFGQNLIGLFSQLCSVVSYGRKDVRGHSISIRIFARGDD